MRILVITLTVILSVQQSMNLFARQACHKDIVTLFPIKKANKWGFVDSSGFLIIQPIYDAAGKFNNGLAVVQKGAFMQLINERGENQFPKEYKKLKSAGKTRYIASNDSLWMLLGSKGEELSKVKYSRIQSRNEETFFVYQNNKLGLIDTIGNELISVCQDSLFYNEEDQFYQAFNDSVVTVYASNFDLIFSDTISELRYFSNSKLFAGYKGWTWLLYQNGENVLADSWSDLKELNSEYLAIKNTNKYALYSISENKIITDERYDELIPFNAKHFQVIRNGNVGLINLQGDEIVPTKYEEIAETSNELILVKCKGKWGAYNFSGENLIPVNYDVIGRFVNGVALVRNGNMMGAINLRGKLLAKPEYPKVELSNGIIKCKKSASEINLIYVDSWGNKISSEAYSNVRSIKIKQKLPSISEPLLQRSGNLLASGSVATKEMDLFFWYYDERRGMWGLKEKETERTVISPRYHGVDVFPQIGLTRVYLNKNKQSYTSTRQEGLVSNFTGVQMCKLEYAHIYMNDFDSIDRRVLARVRLLNDKYALIQRSGKPVKSDITYIGEFKEGVARILYGGRLGWTNDSTLAIDSFEDAMEMKYGANNKVRHSITHYKYRKNVGGKWGYISRKGIMLSNAEFEMVQDAYQGKLIVKKDGKWGVLEKDGSELIPVAYDYIDFMPGSDQQVYRLMEKENKYGMLNAEKQFIIDIVYADLREDSEGAIAVRRGRKWGFVDAFGTPQISLEYKTVGQFHEGVAFARADSKFGFIDHDGNWVIDPIYQKVGDFRNGISWVKLKGKFGFINHQGKVISDKWYTKIYDSYDSLLVVVERSKYGVLNLKGEWVIKPKYSFIEAQESEDVFVVRKESKVGLYNYLGEVVMAPKYSEIGSFSNGFAITKHKGKYGFINAKGEMLIEPLYEQCEPFQEDRAQVKMDGKWGYVNTQGVRVVECMYKHTRAYSDGRAVVKQKLKWGAIDLNGVVILDMVYANLQDFKNGATVAASDGYCFYLDKSGNRMFPQKFKSAMAFYDDKAIVQINERWGVINKNGLWELDPIYSNLQLFEDGSAKVGNSIFYGMARPDGTILMEPEYEYIEQVATNLFRVEKSSRVGYLKTNGNWIWELAR